MQYKYEERKNKIMEILNNDCEIEEKNIPKDDSEFTYNNGIKSWIGSIFVDIIDSKELIQKKEDIVVAKVLRVFTSEVICILNSSDQMRQIGVRGDCVYGIFSTPLKTDIYSLMSMSASINSLIKMINKLLTRKGLPNINAGIGVGVGKDLIVKAGYKGTGINDRIWIGDAVVDACVLADKAGRGGKSNIGFSSLAYDNFIEEFRKRKEGKNVDSWFKKYSNGFNHEYYADLIDPDFDAWIDSSL